MVERDSDSELQDEPTFLAGDLDDDGEAFERLQAAVHDLPLTPEGLMQMDEGLLRARLDELLGRIEEIERRELRDSLLSALRERGIQFEVGPPKVESLEHFFRTGEYPVWKLSVAELSPPSTEDRELFRALMSVYWDCPLEAVAKVEPVADVLSGGEQVMISLACEESDEWARTGGPLELSDRFEKKWLEDPSRLYRVRHQNGQVRWIYHHKSNALLEQGGRVFTRGLQEAFDANHFEPMERSLRPGLPSDDLKRLIGMRNNYHRFYSKVMAWLERRYEGFNQVDYSVTLLDVGVPGQSGPLLKVYLPGDQVEYFSCRQFCESDRELFPKLMKAAREYQQAR